jgi:hypothetical protein
MVVVFSSERESQLVGLCTGAAWLSSARVVRCWVKSRNERNHCPMLPPFCFRRITWAHSWGTAWDNRRKVEMTSSQYGPYALGYTRVTMVVQRVANP